MALRMRTYVKNKMLKTLQKHAPTISILLLVVLLVALLFYPASSSIISTVMIVFGIGAAIAFVVHGNWEKHKEGELSKANFLRNTVLDLLGLALTMGVAMWLGRLAGGYAGQNWGMLAAIVVGIAVGFGVALLVHKLWGKITKQMKIVS